MPEKNKEIICKKCNVPMEKVRRSPPKSLDMYHGTTDISNTSVATSTTIFVPTTGTNTEAYSETGNPSSSAFPKPPIKITSYKCPKCGSTKQIKE